MDLHVPLICLCKRLVVTDLDSLQGISRWMIKGKVCCKFEKLQPCKWNSLREKSPYSEFFRYVFSCIRTEYGKIQSKTFTPGNEMKSWYFYAVSFLPIKDSITGVSLWITIHLTFERQILCIGNLYIMESVAVFHWRFLPNIGFSIPFLRARLYETRSELKPVWDFTSG